MFAVIETGGKQYKVCEGDTLRVEKVEGEPGTEVAIDRVLMVQEGDQVWVGRPRLAGSLVQARILTQDRGPKIRIFKKKRRKGYRRRKGHRQLYTELQIIAIEAPAQAA